MLAPGLTVFSGASKSGKSWLALQMCKALDAGGGFLGALRAEKTAALYFSLEDGQEAVFHRLQKQGNAAFSSSYLATEKMTFNGLAAFLDGHPEIKVVLIDTWQKFAGVADSNDYAENVKTAADLKGVADRRGAAIIVIAHLRKNQTDGGDHLNDTLGSIGLVATADATWTLKRKRGASDARLFVSGRNIEDAEFALCWDRETASWTIAGEGGLPPALPMAQQEVVDILESEARIWKTSEIAERLGKSASAASNILKRLADGGRIESPAYGQYRTFTLSRPPRVCESVKLPESANAASEEAGEELEIW